MFDAELAFKKNSLKREVPSEKNKTSSTSIVMQFCPYVVFKTQHFNQYQLYVSLELEHQVHFQDLIHDKKFKIFGIWNDLLLL